jgi:hypothetical protein
MPDAFWSRTRTDGVYLFPQSEKMIAWLKDDNFPDAVPNMIIRYGENFPSKLKAMQEKGLDVQESHVEKVSIWFRVWTEGFGIPKTVWFNEDVIRAGITKDGLEIFEALEGRQHDPGWTQQARDALADPANKLELLQLAEQVRRDER